MSFKADDTEEQRAIQSQLKEMNMILSGILAGIAIMNELTPQQLIELGENK